MGIHVKYQYFADKTAPVSEITYWYLNINPATIGEVVNYISALISRVYFERTPEGQIADKLYSTINLESITMDTTRMIKGGMRISCSYSEQTNDYVIREINIIIDCIQWLNFKELPVDPFIKALNEAFQIS